MTQAYGQIGLRFKDERGEAISTPLYFNIVDTTTIAALTTAVQTTQEVVQALSDAECLKCSAILSVPLGDTTTPAVGSSIERNALFRHLVVDGYTRHWGFDVPSPKLSIFYAGSKFVDPANAAVQAYVAMIEEVTGLIFNTPGGNAIDAYVDGRMTFRKHRRVANRT